MVKAIGRILLIVAAVMLVTAALPNVIDTIKYFNEVGWIHVVEGQENLSRFGTMLGHGVNLLFALIAVIAALVGKKSFLLALTALILLVAPGMTIYGWVSTGAAFEWQMVATIATSFTAPLLYFMGFLLL
jgi:hypothetical protein